MNRRDFLRGAIALPVAAAAAPLAALLPAPALPVFGRVYHPRTHLVGLVYEHDTFYKTFEAGMDEVFLAE